MASNCSLEAEEKEPKLLSMWCNGNQIPTKHISKFLESVKFKSFTSEPNFRAPTLLMAWGHRSTISGKCTPSVSNPFPEKERTGPESFWEMTVYQNSGIFPLHAVLGWMVVWRCRNILAFTPVDHGIQANAPQMPCISAVLRR